MNASERMSENNYYLESNKTNNNTPERSFPTPYPNDNIRQSRRDSTEKELSVLSSASESIAGQSPTLTDSQQKDFVFERERIKLNNILHTES